MWTWGGTCAAHVPINTATEMRNTTIGNLKASPAARGTHGGFRGRDRCGHASSRDAHAESSGADMTPPCDCSPSVMAGIGNPNIGPITTLAPREGSQPNGSPLPKTFRSPENNPSPSIVP